MWWKRAHVKNTTYPPAENADLADANLGYESVGKPNRNHAKLKDR